MTLIPPDTRPRADAAHVTNNTVCRDRPIGHPDSVVSNMIVQTANNTFGAEYMAHRPAAIHVHILALTARMMPGVQLQGPRLRVPFGENALEIRQRNDAASSSELCVQCQNFSPRQKFQLTSMRQGEVKNYEWSLRQVKESKATCSFCSFMISTIGLGGAVTETADPDALVRLELKPMIHEGFDWSGGFHGFSISLAAKDIAATGIDHCICPHPGNLEPLIKLDKSNWWKRETDTIELRDFPRRVNIEDLKSMLEICMNKDYQCRPHFEEIPDLRVIDVREGRVVPAPPQCRYAALSYVWGRVEQTRLTGATETLLTTAGSVHPHAKSLSKVVRDALYLCDALKYPYLWIDTLCIKQDDEHHKRTQIAYMDAVYRRADFTIVAAAGTDCNSGLPGLREDRETRTDMLTGVVDEMRLVGAHMMHKHPFLQSVWNSRGWTLQEQVFSRRALVFTEVAAYFVCSQRTVREEHIFSPSDFIGASSPDILWDWTLASRPFEEEEAPPVPHLFCTDFPQEPTGTSAFKLWQELLPLYLQRNLTNSSDVINAFKGVLRALEKPLQGFRNAMPRKFFARSLLWYGLHHRREADEFPSWSWAAWERSSRSNLVGFQDRNDCVQWTPIFAASQETLSDPKANFREPETFGSSNSHDHFRGQEHFSCSNIPEGTTFDVDRNFAHEHFATLEVDQPTKDNITSLLSPQNILSNVIFFYTSVLSVAVNRSPTTDEHATSTTEPSLHQVKQYAIRASDGAVLDNILLTPSWRDKQPDKLSLIAIFIHEDRYPPVFAMALTKPSEYMPRHNRDTYHPGKYPSSEDCYAVVAMLVEWDESGIARRVGLPQENAFYYKTWLREEPVFKVVALA